MSWVSLMEEEEAELEEQRSTGFKAYTKLPESNIIKRNTSQIGISNILKDCGSLIRKLGDHDIQMNDPILFTATGASRSNFEITHTSQNGKFRYHCPDENLHSTLRQFLKNYVCSYRDGKKVRHEAVSYILSTQQTDIKLSSVFDIDSEKTPDFIFFVEPTVHDRGAYLVLEIGTTANANFLSITYDKKLTYYISELEEIAMREQLKIFYGIMIVSPINVFTNINLTMQQVDLICSAYALGEAIYKYSIAERLIEPNEPDDFEHISMKAKSIDEEISSFSYEERPEDTLYITKQYISEILSEQFNEEEVLKAHKTGMERGLREIQEIGEDKYILAERYKDQIEHSFQELDRESVNKTKQVLNVPLLLMQESCAKTESKIPIFPKGEDDLSKLWYDALKDYFTKEMSKETREKRLLLLVEKMNTPDVLIEDYKPEIKKHSSKEGKFDAQSSLGKDSFKKLAEDGICAKRLKNDPVILEKRKEKSKSLSPYSSTDEIEKYLNKKELLEGNQLYGQTTKHIIELISRSQDLAGNENPIPLSFAKKILGTKLAQGLFFIADLVNELQVEMINHCAPGFCIVKKMAMFEAYLIIFTTRSGSHTFYSIFIPENVHCEILDTDVFRPPRVNNGYLIFDFVSLQKDKIKNLLCAPSNLLCFSSFWLDHYDIPLDDAIKMDNFPSGFIKMLLLTLAISLQDKTRTEEIITLSRYYTVDILNVQNRVSFFNPCKLISKHPTILRSSLEVYILRKLTSWVHRMILNPPVKVRSKRLAEKDEQGEEMSELSHDLYTGFINMFTGEEIKSARKILQLQYLGYAVNKDKNFEGNVDDKLVDKVLKLHLELKDEDIPTYHKMNIRDLPKPMHFSSSIVNSGSILIARSMEKTLGKNWKEAIANNICTALAKHMTHSIATLRASCSVNLEKIRNLPKEDRPAGIADDIKKAKKVIETLSSHLHTFRENPFLNLRAILDYLHSEDMSMLVKLFKKCQHGGLREISILEIHSRIVALFIETCSREILSFHDRELITHPANATQLIENHKYKAYESAMLNGAVVIESATTSDKSKWSQRLTIKALCIPLIKLLPERFHAAIQQCMNIWVDKRIMVPEAMMKLLEKGENLSSSTYSFIKGELNNRAKMKETRVMKDGCFMTIPTSMLQGILHLTSSLYHLCLLHINDFCTAEYFKEFKNKPVLTNVCSSDDSAALLTIIVQRPNEVDDNFKNQLRLLKISCDLCMYANEDMARCFGMQPSEKNVVGCTGFIEVLSKFMVGNSIVIPVLKYIFSCCNMTPCETFVNKYQIFNNQLEDLSVAGLPAFNVMICQMAQQLLHYITIGARSNVMFDLYSNLLLECPEPTLGFFPASPQFIPCRLGYAFDDFLLRKKAKLFIKPTRLAMMNIEGGELTPMTSGLVSHNICIKFGDNQRYKRLIHNVCGTDSIAAARAELNDKPHLIFMSPKSADDVRFKLKQKCFAPGVAESLSGGDKFYASLSSSVYSSISQCWNMSRTLSENSEEGTLKLNKTIHKVTLYSALKRKFNFTKTVEYQREQDSINDNDLRQIYSCYNIYTEVEKLIQNLNRSEYNYVVKKNRRVCYNTCLLHSAHVVHSISLLEICQIKWFDKVHTYSKRKVEDVWSRYKQLYCWLSETVEETLRLSPLNDYLSLYSYLSSTSLKSRIMGFYGPVIKPKSTIAWLNECLRINPMTNKYIKHQKLVVSKSNDARCWVQQFLLGTYLPKNSKGKDTCQKLIEDLSDNELSLMIDKSLTTREADILSIIRYCRNPNLEDSRNFLSSLLKRHQGMIVTYEQAQKFDEENRRYYGPGKVRLIGERIVVKLHIMDDEVTHIEVSNVQELSNYASMIYEKMRELKVKGRMEHARNVLRPVGIARGLGCPYSESSELAEANTSLNNINISMRVSPGLIKAVQIIGSREFVVYKCKITSNMIYSEVDSILTSSDWEEAWIRYGEYKLNPAVNKLLSIQSALEKGKNLTEEQSFLKDSFVTAFSRYNMNYIQSSNNPIYIPQDNLDEFVLNLDELEDMIGFLKELPTESIDEPTIDEDILRGFAEALLDENVEYTRPRYEEHFSSPYDYHPLWKSVLRKFSGSVLSSESSSDYVVIGIRKLLGLNPNEFVVKLED
ncbi:MAG: RNA-dependent RNA polymerase [Hangzhou phenuivirus 1]|nr:MAG: RNA-dependent RNA polymerase [Hangzhou phenuivirus 1]